MCDAFGVRFIFGYAGLHTDEVIWSTLFSLTFSADRGGLRHIVLSDRKR
jgi:hypothetical protein